MFPRNTQVAPDFEDHRKRAATPVRSAVFGEKAIDFVLVYNVENGIVAGNENQSNEEKTALKKKAQLRKKSRAIFVENLRRSGLIVEKIKYEKEGYILVTTPFDKLLEIAEKTKLKLPIEKNDFESENKSDGCLRTIRNIFELPKGVADSKVVEYFTASYSSSLHDKFSKFFGESEDKIISPKDRCLLTYEVLSRTSYSKLIEEDLDESVSTSSTTDFKVGIERLLANGSFQAAFPPHEPLDKDVSVSESNLDQVNNRQKLHRYWASGWRLFSYQPLDLVRDYFGEKLAFYFAWLGFYTSWLIIATIFGILVLIYGLLTVSYDRPISDICDEKGIGNLTMCPLCTAEYCEDWKLYETCFYSKLNYSIDNPATILFAVVISIWAVFFIEFWKRNQSELQFEWDTEDFEKNIETIRPEFEVKVQTTRKNRVTGLIEPYVPLSRRVFKYLVSFSAVILMVFLVLAFLIAVIIYRVIIKTLLYQSSSTRPLSSTITSATAAVVNLIIIVILGRFYSWLAIKLTRLELHRTDSEYEDSLTIKMYLFQFVNYYGSIFYIAFFKGRNFSNKIGDYDLQEQCEPSGCMTELTIQLIIIMVGKQFLSSVQQIFLPLIQNKFKSIIKKDTTEDQLQWVKDYKLIDWGILSLFDEYLEMVIQYGFMTLFTVAFPLGPLFSFINNIIEIRIDSYKLLTQYKRPLPKKAQSIGIWLPILNVVSALGVITNAFIIAFTSDFVPRLVYQFFYNDGTLNGYVKFTLSVRNFTELNPQQTNPVEICYYRDFREPYDSPNKYQYTNQYYVILFARLAFIVVFEHFVFLLVTVLHFLIPDVPGEVQDQIERENYITQRAIWAINPEVFERARSVLDAIDEETSQPDRAVSADLRMQNTTNLRTFAQFHSDDDDDLVLANNNKNKTKHRKNRRRYSHSLDNDSDLYDDTNF